MIKQQLLQIGSVDSYFNNHTSLFQKFCPNPFVAQYSSEFQISCQNRLVIKQMSISENFIKIGEDKYINLANVCMQKIVHPKTGLFGVKLSKNGVSFEIFGQLDEWINVMKKYTIQLDFGSRYQLYNKLGEGYSTIIYKARNQVTKQEYAVKVFDKNRLLTNNYESKNFLKELKITRLLEHSHLLSCYEVFESNNHIYLLQEYLKGEKLSQIIQNSKPLKENQVQIVMEPLFQAVQYLHNLNIYHKQICTSNIILKQKRDLSNPCLIGFNQAEQFYNPENDDYQYLQVNQEKQKQYYNKYDVLSLGIVMHNLLTGNNSQFEQTINDAMMNKFQGTLDFQFIDPPLSDQCFDFLTIIFNQGQQIRTCKQLLQHPFFNKEIQKSIQNISIQFLGTLNQSQNMFRINTKKQQMSPKTSRDIKVVPIRKQFNLISKSPQEKFNNVNSDYFEPPKTHLMFRRGSRQKRTLNFNQNRDRSNDSAN
ncbi:unnamed protein product [Paramecium sonneborni]|uniref:Protein kinase domain-containing protein n=1 Tax=Paramecium sonneborni TaxID=65129 RepID=A0A8S1KXA4_9CILI|nr:unnamed protein product [Paramecium sonneborni]